MTWDEIREWIQAALFVGAILGLPWVMGYVAIALGVL